MISRISNIDTRGTGNRKSQLLLSKFMKVTLKPFALICQSKAWRAIFIFCFSFFASFSIFVKGKRRQSNVPPHPPPFPPPSHPLAKPSVKLREEEGKRKGPPAGVFLVFLLLLLRFQFWKQHHRRISYPFQEKQVS